MERKTTSVLNKIESIDVKKTSDIVLEKIRELILDGTLTPGDQLPPERDLSQKFGVGRGHIREAIKKLEFYGIVKIIPQSGTVVANQGIPLLEHMISNIIKLEKSDKLALVEAREILEVNAAKLAAEKVNQQQIDLLQMSLDAHQKAIDSGFSGLNEDLVFHLKIAEMSGNAIIHSTIMLITPQVHQISKMSNSCRDGRAFEAWMEHKYIVDAIVAHDMLKAGETMEYHLKNARKSFSL
jgi:GntR family transcriptional repressor for pyruvate dehydrogenase complex